MPKSSCTACLICTALKPCAIRKIELTRRGTELRRAHRASQTPAQRTETNKRHYQVRCNKPGFSEAQAERMKIYRKAEPGRYREYVANRRAKKLQATPKWADRKKIKRIYDLAHQQKEMTGDEVVCDHVVPLSHPLVCGLHNEFNLQIVIDTYNLKKSNRTWPDMPGT